MQGEEEDEDEDEVGNAIQPYAGGPGSSLCIKLDVEPEAGETGGLVSFSGSMSSPRASGSFASHDGIYPGFSVYSDGWIYVMI